MQSYVHIKQTIDGSYNTYYLHDQNGKPVELGRSEGEKDLGVIVDDKVNFENTYNNRSIKPIA